MEKFLPPPPKKSDIKNNKLRSMLQSEPDAYLIIYSASSGSVVLLCFST